MGDHEEGDPISDPMEDLGEPTRPVHLPLAARLRRIRSIIRREEAYDNIPLVVHEEVGVICWTTLKEMRRLHVKPPEGVLD